MSLFPPTSDARCSNDDTFEMETASSDALVQIQLLEASCDLMLAADANQVCDSTPREPLPRLHFNLFCSCRCRTQRQFYSSSAALGKAACRLAACVSTAAAQSALTAPARRDSVAMEKLHSVLIACSTPTAFMQVRIGSGAVCHC